MSLPVVLRHQAAEELLAACDYYEAKRPGLGVRLLGEIRRALGRISTHPDLHGIVLHDVRRAAVRRFPYGIFYRALFDKIEVLAVFHDSRDPTAWQDRS